MNTLLSANVPDPTDFPPLDIAPGLRTLDGSLRCDICGELYDAPVTLNCGHCFCSFCIRASLAEKQECPACRKIAMEGHLRPNPVVEEMVSAWKLSRPYMLNLSKEDERQRTTPITPKAKKRKITPDTGNNSSASTSRDASVLASPTKPRRLPQISSDLFGATIPTSDADEDEMPELTDGNQNPGPDDLVDCPLCNKRVKYKTINLHMDKGCKDPPPASARSTKSDWEKIMTRPHKGKQKDTSDDEHNFALPKASYATLKDKQLKEMLVEHGLPTHGDRNQWIHRHQRWVMIYNANLDRSKGRRSKPELRKELKKWEDEKSKKKKTTVDDTVAHEKRHRDEFAQLVDAARPRGDKGVSTVTKAERSLLTERSNSDITIHLSDDKLQEKSRPEQHRAAREEDVIVVDSEEEREMVEAQRT